MVKDMKELMPTGKNDSDGGQEDNDKYKDKEAGEGGFGE